MTIRSSTSTRIVSSTAITGVKPSGSVAGDRLLVWLVTDGSASSITPPAGDGWTLLATASTASPADTNKAFVYEKKVSTGSETYAFVNSATKSAIIQVVALTGRHASTAAVVGTPTITNTSAASPLSVAVAGVTAVGNDDVLLFGQIDQVAGADTWSFGAIGGYTQLQNDANGAWTTSACFAKEGVSAGATGTLTSSVTRLTGTSNGAWSGVVVSLPSAVTDPTVTSVTSTATPEGTATVHTVTLSGPTNRDTAYAYSWGTATATGADYTQTLTTAMCARTGGASGNVTVSGSNITAETGVSAFTITVPTTQDALDEDSETIVLTVGSVASTGGTITDDDALPSITITPSITVDGGDSVVLTCTLGAVSGRVSQARLVLADGTKVGGVDYTNVITDGMLSDGVTISAGVLSIPAGVGSFTITIPTTP